MTSRFRELSVWVADHPFLAISGWLVTILSVPLAIYCYAVPYQKRELAILEPPVRSVFVNRDLPAVLDVRIGGMRVEKKDVFAAQFGIWNNGNQSIRPEHVLEPVKLVAADGTRIVDAQLLRKSREVCNVSVHVESDGKAAMLDWKILEPDDGAIVQLVLVGDSESAIGIQGIVEGGGKRYVRIASPSTKSSKALWSPANGWDDLVIGGAIMGCFLWGGLHALLKDLPKAWRKRHLRRGRTKVSQAMAGGVLLLLIGGALAFAFAHDAMTGLHLPPTLLKDLTRSDDRSAN